MKFKAFLTDTGVQLLEKRVLPALEKMGRSCHVYITPSHFCFLHNLLNSEYRFSLDLALLQRALRSLSASSRSSFPTPHSPLPSPFLTFEARGHSSALIQDVPVSRPLSRAAPPCCRASSTGVRVQEPAGDGGEGGHAGWRSGPHCQGEDAEGAAKGRRDDCPAQRQAFLQGSPDSSAIWPSPIRPTLGLPLRGPASLSFSTSSSRGLV